MVVEAISLRTSFLKATAGDDRRGHCRGTDLLTKKVSNRKSPLVPVLAMPVLTTSLVFRNQ